MVQGEGERKINNAKSQLVLGECIGRAGGAEGEKGAGPLTFVCRLRNTFSVPRSEPILGFTLFCRHSYDRCAGAN